MLKLHGQTTQTYQDVIAEICALDWAGLSEAEFLATAWAYYFFSVQFRENLEIACELYPEDANLARLKREECATSNLSPYPGVAAPGEAMDHDEFMRRALTLAPIDAAAQARYEAEGRLYLQEVRALEPIPRALSISSYEDGGLEALFKAMLRAPDFANPAAQAFRFFLSEHIRFDSDPDQGHGSLSRHLVPDDSVLDFWVELKRLYLAVAPRLRGAAA